MVSLLEVNGAIAQLGERIVRNDEVVGSIPTSSTKISSSPVFPRTLDGYFTQVAINPIAAADINAAVVQPRMFIAKPLARVPITCLLFATNMINTSSGGARNPLITAVQKSALMGLMPMKLISMPTRV